MNKNIIIEKYKLDPCRFHASALWKTLIQGSLKIDIQNEKNEVIRIKIYTNNALFLYWDKNSNDICDINEYQLALLHHSQITEQFQNNEKYFRLKHENKTPLFYKTDYKIKDVDVSRETKQAAEFINRCYEDINLAEIDIRLWTHRPVYDKKLWIWITDKTTEEYLGLGIAEYDKEIKEGSLEWIQVLPEYQGKGVGKAIVNELLRRMQKADFIIVSGSVDDIFAEKLYRSCGFKGDDIWYVVKK